MSRIPERDVLATETEPDRVHEILTTEITRALSESADGALRIVPTKVRVQRMVDSFCQRCRQS